MKWICVKYRPTLTIDIPVYKPVILLLLEVLIFYFHKRYRCQISVSKYYNGKVVPGAGLTCYEQISSMVAL